MASLQGSSLHSHHNLDDVALLPLMSSRSGLLSRLEARRNSHGTHQNVSEQSATGLLSQLMNTPIADGFDSSGILHSKRFSIGLGMGSDHFPSVSFDTKCFDKGEIRSAAQPAKDDLCGDLEVESSSKKQQKKRRLGSIGYLSSSLFDEHGNANRRGSMSSIATFQSVGMEGLAKPTEPTEHDEDASLLSEPDTSTNGVATACATTLPSRPRNIEIAAPTKVKETMEAFTAAMTKSQKSQQAIHDWDKKMGLKRSHSKTMRLSMRSRKKLKTLVKKEVSLLAKS